MSELMEKLTGGILKTKATRLRLEEAKLDKQIAKLEGEQEAQDRVERKRKKLKQLREKVR